MTEYFMRIAAAFVRGKLQDSKHVSIHAPLFTKALYELSDNDMEVLVELGKECNLRLHRFKRTMELPRVHRVLGILKGLQPQSLLDIGSGRGAFLWPLMNDLPFLPVTCIDMLDYRVADIQAVYDGGIEHLTALQGDATYLPFADRTFDVVTMLVLPNSLKTGVELF